MEIWLRDVLKMPRILLLQLINLFKSNRKDLTFSTRLFILVFTLLFHSIFSSTSTSNAHPHLTTSSKVSVNGIGPILIGMTVEEAEAAAGVELLPFKSDEKYLREHCRYYYPNINRNLIYLMVYNNKITRIDIPNKNLNNNNNPITTISGAKIGNTIEEIKSIYPQQIKIEPGFYGGKYLIYEPHDSAYKNYLLLFQTYEGVVHDFRAGYVHDVKYLVEGCS